MSTANSQQTPQKRINLGRAIILVNFILMLALAGPGSSHQVDLVLRRAGVANLITLALQVWFIGSTLVVTLFFAWRLRRSDGGAGRRPAKLDWVLLAAWWCVVILLSMYAFMMGMGG